MNFPLAARELIVVARRQVLSIVIATYAALLAAFTVVWGLKLPTLTGTAFYESFRNVQTGLLIILMAWVVVRSSALDRHDHMVRLSAMVARRPSSVVIAKMLSLCGVLALVVMAGVPAAIVASKMSAIPSSIVWRDIASALALALAASVVTTLWMLATGGPLSAWVGSAATIVAVLLGARWFVAGQLAQDVSVTAIVVVLAGVAAVWSDRVFRYCHE